MVNELVKRDSDGKVVDLPKQNAEQAEIDARAKRVTLVDSSGNEVGTEANRLEVEANLEVSDIQIGAVEIKDAESGNRATVNDSGQLHTVLRGTIDSGNSTETPLLANETFTGTPIDTLDYSAVALVVYSDVASITDGLKVQYSSDASHWHDGELYTIEAGATKFFTPTMQDRYMRVVYTNDGTDQTDFHIHTTLRKSPIKWSSHRIQDDLKDEDDGELALTVLKLRTAQDNYVSGAATNNGNFKVSLEELESGISSNSNSQLNVTPYHADGTEGALITGIDYVSGKSGIDSITETLQTISYEHHEIHGGSHFNICGYQSFANGQVLDFTVVTPNTTQWTHMTFSIEGSGAVSVEIKEGATVNTTGSPVTAFNNNRNSANTTSLTIRTGDTYSAEGTSIYSKYSGANKIAGNVDRNAEFILKQNTTYIFRITNQTTLANIISWCADWYEHTNKN